MPDNLTPNQAKLLQSLAQPCEQLVQITAEMFESTGVPLGLLQKQPFYRGQVMANSDEVAHVMERTGLERASGGKWSQYETARLDKRLVENGR